MSGTGLQTASGGAEPLAVMPLLPGADFVPAKVPGVRKAAVLLVALGHELATGLLQDLSERDVALVTAEIARMGDVPAALLEQVLTEFYGLLETQRFVVRGGREYALRVLTDAFGSARAEHFLAQIEQMEKQTNADLIRLQGTDPQQLSKFLENEHPQTVALVLAHLEPERGSALLMQLKPPQRVETVRRLAEMRQFSPEMVNKVAATLSRRLQTLGTTGRQSYSGFKSVADLLNRLDQMSSKEILEDIEKSEPKLAINIRDLMFTFDDLQTIPQTSVREIVAATDKRVLATALKGAKESVRAHLFKAMSSRAMEMLAEDMDAMGPIRNKDVTRAQQELLAVARRLEAEGKVVLTMEVEGEFTV